MSTERSDDDLLGFIASTVETIRDQMATKSELQLVRDQMATKSELAQLRAELLAETMAIRGDLEQVHLRLDSIERTLSTRLDQMETELSRMRSAIYLLAKDRPEILRLLGQGQP